MQKIAMFSNVPLRRVFSMHDRASIPNDIAKLVGKRFVTSGETGATRRLNEAGAEIITSKSPEDFAQFMKAQNERFAKVIKEVGVVTE